jgi:hypothetical protein
MSATASGGFAVSFGHQRSKYLKEEYDIFPSTFFLIIVPVNISSAWFIYFLLFQQVLARNLTKEEAESNSPRQLGQTIYSRYMIHFAVPFTNVPDDDSSENQLKEQKRRYIILFRPLLAMWINS